MEKDQPRYAEKESLHMKLAVNYSVEALQLIQESKIHVDMIKCPDFSSEIIAQAKRLKPSYIHFALNAGSRQMDKVNWEHIKQLKDSTQTPYINVHAVAFTKDYDGIDVFTTDQNVIEHIIDAVVQDISIVADVFGADNVILENVVCRGQGENMLQPIVAPDVLTEIVVRSGCGFLLDIAHAQMTSKCLNFDVKKYISDLPLNYLKELHITGIQKDHNGRLRDSMPMTEDDWELTNWAIQQIKQGIWPEPWIVAFEYGGVGPKFEWRTNKDVLATQVPVISEILK